MIIELARKAGVLNRQFRSYRQRIALSNKIFWPLGFIPLCLVYFIVNGLIAPAHPAVLAFREHDGSFGHFVSMMLTYSISFQMFTLMLLPYFYGYKLARLLGMDWITSVKLGVYPYNYEYNGTMLKYVDVLPALRQFLNEEHSQQAK